MNFKSFIPAIILTAAYVAAESFLPPFYALIAIIGLSIIDIIYSRFVEKRFDWFVLFLTAVFCIPSAVKVWLSESWLKEMESILYEFIIAGTFFIFYCAKIKNLPGVHQPQQTLNNEQIKLLQRISLFMSLFLIGHIILTMISYFVWSKTTTNFIGNELLYILIGVIFLGFIIKQRLHIRKLQKEEWLPIVNEHGDVQGKAPRSICHGGSKLLHPVVHLHIINKSGDIFLQKRSMKKDLLPGKWDTAVGGHIGLNETVENALKRETREELGIQKFDAKFINSYVWESPRERELVFSFVCTKYDPMHIDNDEVDEGRFWKIHEIEEGIQNEQLTPNFAYEFEHTLKKWTMGN